MVLAHVSNHTGKGLRADEHAFDYGSIVITLISNKRNSAAIARSGASTIHVAGLKTTGFSETAMIKGIEFLMQIFSI